MQGMKPEDIGALRRAADPVVAPDGSQVAFTVTDIDLQTNEYRTRIWLAEVNGSASARPYTAGPDDQLPRWSPDGRCLAFVANGAEGHEMCIIPVAGGGERRPVCSWPERIEELAWSPDGTRLALVGRDPDPERYGPPGSARPEKDMPPRRLTRVNSRLNGAGWTFDRPTRIAVVPADGSARPRRVTQGAAQATNPAWSPDGTKLAFASARHDTRDLDFAVDLWVVHADGSNEPTRLTETVAAYASPSWSPDGRHLAFLRTATPAERPCHSQVGVLDVDTGDRRELTRSLDRNCGHLGNRRALAWIGDDILFAIEDGGNVHLYRTAVDASTEPELVFGGTRWVEDWDCAAGTLAATVTSATTFPELIVAELAASGGAATGERQVTRLTDDFAARVHMVAPERFVAVSADGSEVECWAIAPVGSSGDSPNPTILNVHGGPFTQYGNRLFDEFQVQAGAGFGVIYCNPRGSAGYSEAWGRAVRWPECKTDPGSGWGTVDYEDVMACVDEATRRFAWVDPERLGIMGGSYGGYMTSWTIGHTNRFKAALSERSCNNLLTMEYSSDISGFIRSYIGPSHLEDPAAYQRQSPVTYLDAMTTPVLIVHSEGDLRCPISQAEELFVGLRLLGRHAELVRFPAETHELSRSGAPCHRVMRAQLVLDWFGEHLQ